MDPITQSKILISNINTIKNNILEIGRQLGLPVNKLTSLADIPCSVSKKLSEQVCNYNLVSALENQLNALQTNIEQLNQMQNNQSGGKYPYIINPVTNRKVSINSRLGKKIINNYSKYL